MAAAPEAALMSPEAPLLSEAPSDAEKDKDDSQLDIAEEDSFPASDPPSITDPNKTVKSGNDPKKA
jgi:hypothetical protein